MFNKSLPFKKIFHALNDVENKWGQWRSKLIYQILKTIRGSLTESMELLDYARSYRCDGTFIKASSVRSAQSFFQAKTNISDLASQPPNFRYWNKILCMGD